MDRGLKYAKDFIIDAIISTYCLFKKLISEKYENIFINCGINHKTVVKTLSLKKLEISEFNLDASSTCKCGNSLLSLSEMCTDINILQYLPE